MSGVGGGGPGDRRKSSDRPDCFSSGESRARSPAAGRGKPDLARRPFYARCGWAIRGFAPCRRAVTRPVSSRRRLTRRLPVWAAASRSLRDAGCLSVPTVAPSASGEPGAGVSGGGSASGAASRSRPGSTRSTVRASVGNASIGGGSRAGKRSGGRRSTWPPLSSAERRGCASECLSRAERDSSPDRRRLAGHRANIAPSRSPLSALRRGPRPFPFVRPVPPPLGRVAASRKYRPFTARLEPR